MIFKFTPSRVVVLLATVQCSRQMPCPRCDNSHPTLRPEIQSVITVRVTSFVSFVHDFATPNIFEAHPPVMSSQLIIGKTPNRHRNGGILIIIDSSQLAPRRDFHSIPRDLKMRCTGRNN